MSFDTHCLYSQVQNISGGRLCFSFLPPHGRELQANESYTIFGNVYDAVAGMDGGDRATSKTHVIAFLTALSSGLLAIVKTPQPVLLDQTTGATKLLNLNNNILGVVAPCWTLPGSVVDASGGRDYTG
jgi:hypothetical protein